MITLFNNLNKAQETLSAIKQSGKIQDFSLILSLNEVLIIYVRVPDGFVEELEVKTALDFMPSRTFTLVIVTDSEYNDDSYYQLHVFNEKNKTTKIHLESGRRRFNSLLGVSEKVELPVPIITFYSYKGGMGRSTTMAFFASYLAHQHKQKVVIIDCDFEAPGFTNFFLPHSGEENQRNGLVEYVFDKQFAENPTEFSKQIKEYMWQTGSEYSGDGKIFVMPAGNLNTRLLEDVLDDIRKKNDFLPDSLQHYLQGFARLDLTNQKNIAAMFSNIIEDINIQIAPDIILIDSRTGFNDIFGFSAFHLSDIVVGFFGDSVQHRPGLSNFIQEIAHIKGENRPDIVLVNSILPSSGGGKHFAAFKDSVRNAIADANRRVESIEDEFDMEKNFYPIYREDRLQKIGTVMEDIEGETIGEIIKGARPIVDYQQLFERIWSSPILKKKTHRNEFKTNTEDIMVSPDTNVSLIKKEDKNDFNTDNPKKLKKQLIAHILHPSNKPKLDGKREDVKRDFIDGRFFYRTCMSDLFNINKKFVIGSKGTGKSYMYQALNETEIVTDLQQKYNQNGKFYFIHTIDKDTDGKILRIEDTKLSPKQDNEWIRRFWTVYTWLSVREQAGKIGYLLDGNIAVQPIKDTFTFRQYMDSMQVDVEFLKVEQELEQIDQFLLSLTDTTYILPIYDQLDEMIKPHLWNLWVRPLIDYWKVTRYKRIIPKLFLRRDLLRKMREITNIHEIENNAVDIDWTQAEMYAYFFKIVLSQKMDTTFFDLISIYGESKDAIARMKDAIKNNNSQFPLEKHLLQPIVHYFFGESAAVKSAYMGDSYTWFYENLKNADDTISLRPFIELIYLAFERQQEQDASARPVLPPVYYMWHSVREQAVNNHFKAIASEKGNEALNVVFEFIGDTPKFQMDTLLPTEFDEMLGLISTKKPYKDRSDLVDILKLEKPNEALKSLLITNGIVKENITRNGKFYTFAYLYKYKLRLKGRHI